MTSQEFQEKGFDRVERDDRLLDVFLNETPDKGVELWEKWDDKTVEIVRIHNKKSTRHQFLKKEIEEALLENEAIEIKMASRTQGPQIERR